MVKHMNRDVVLALSPRRAPKPVYLFVECRMFVRVVSRYFGVDVAEINAPPLIWQTISALGGSRESQLLL
jgi:hypothetical protein